MTGLSQSIIAESHSNSTTSVIMTVMPDILNAEVHCTLGIDQ